VAGIPLEYVPDMTVFHDHGRKAKAAGYKLMRTYMTANGALFAKYLFKHPNLCRPVYWDIKNSITELLAAAIRFCRTLAFAPIS
jgi:GT2 family glycosyltransferase